MRAQEQVSLQQNPIHSDISTAPAEQKEVNFSPAIGPITGLSGFIKSVGPGNFMLTTVIVNEGVKTTTILIDSTTIISRLVAKDEALLKKQRAEAVANGTPPPEPYTNETIGLSDLSEGMLVTVEFVEATQATSATAHAKSVDILPITP